MTFEKIKELYNSGRLSEAGLDKAVRLGWITEEQKEQIVRENEENNAEEEGEAK